MVYGSTINQIITCMPTETSTRHNSAANHIRRPTLQSIYEHRHMIRQLIIRDFKARYTQSALGLLWLIISPIITIIVFTFVFKNLANVPSYDIPYPIFSFAALVPWEFFNRSMTEGIRCLLTNKQLITDVYVPRILIPLIAQATSMIDMLVNFCVFVLLMIVFRFTPSLNILLLPFFVVQIFLLSTGMVLIFSALQVRLRDVATIMGFLMRILIFLSPVAYPSQLVENELGAIYWLNPLVGILDGWRWAVLGIEPFDGFSALLSWITTICVLMAGLYVFARSETTFADWI